MDAEKIVPQDKPTMMLNLKGLSRESQRSLVIHEFGHALGLDHEHQRSDFWATMKEYIDLSRVPEGERVRLQKRDDMEREEFYDPDSIMHYWWVCGILVTVALWLGSTHHFWFHMYSQKYPFL